MLFPTTSVDVYCSISLGFTAATFGRGAPAKERLDVSRQFKKKFEINIFNV